MVKSWLATFVATWIVAVAVAVMACCGCASYNKDQLEAFERTAPVLLAGAEELGLEADAEIKWGGQGQFGNVFLADLGTDAAVWMRARPGEISKQDLLNVIYILVAKDSPEAVSMILDHQCVEVEE